MSYNNLAWCMLQNSLNVLGGTVSFAPLMGLWFAMITRDSPTVSTTKINQQNLFALMQIGPYWTIQNSPTSQFKPVAVNCMSYTSLIVLLLDNSMYKRVPQQWGNFGHQLFGLWFLIYSLWFWASVFDFFFLKLNFWIQFSKNQGAIITYILLAFWFLKIKKQIGHKSPRVLLSYFS